MKISFIVPTLNLTGGLRVVAEYASHLKDMGHEVSIYFPDNNHRSLFSRLKNVFTSTPKVSIEFDDTFFRDISNQTKLIPNTSCVRGKDIPDADIVVATFWRTAEWVIDYPASKGYKVYLVQHYEVHPWFPRERVVMTYEASFKKIVVSRWIADILVKNHNCRDITVINNAVDISQFYPDEVRKKNDSPVFGMMFSNRAYKRSNLAIETFLSILAIHPRARLLAYGTEKIEDTPFYDHYWVDYTQTPGSKEIRKIYNNCDAWLFTSDVEGFGLPILESLACATPVIATDAGAARELLSSGGGLLCENQNELLNAALSICLMSHSDWLSMSIAACDEAIKHDWNEKSKQFEHVISELVTT